MTFKLKHSLKKHQLTHKAEFGHTCEFCGKKFKVSYVANARDSKRELCLVTGEVCCKRLKQIQIFHTFNF